MAHKISLYDPSHFDRSCYGPVGDVAVADTAALFDTALAEARRIGHPFAICVSVDPDLCADAAEYARLSNIDVDVLDVFHAEGAFPGCWKSRLMEEPEHWAEVGARTARELADLLDHEHAHEVEEASWR